MIVLKKYEDVLKVLNERKDVSIDLSQMNDIDYTKSIDFIKQLKVMVKKITRSKFSFIYD